MSVLIVRLHVMLLSSPMNHEFFLAQSFSRWQEDCLWMLSSWMSWKFFIEYVLCGCGRWGCSIFIVWELAQDYYPGFNTFWLKRFGFRLEFLKLAFTVRFWVVLVFAQIWSIRSLMLLKAGFMCSAQFMTLLMWKIFF